MIYGMLLAYVLVGDRTRVAIDYSYGTEMSRNRLAQLRSSDESMLGKLLVASPRVPVGFPFTRAVILILQDSEEGVFGVVLNRPASPKMLMEWQKLAGKPTFAAEKLVAGGPVEGPVLAIHREQNLAEVEIKGGLFVSVQQDAIEQLSEMEFYEDDVSLRIVLGAVSWNTASSKTKLITVFGLSPMENRNRYSRIQLLCGNDLSGATEQTRLNN